MQIYYRKRHSVDEINWLDVLQNSKTSRQIKNIITIHY